MPHVNLCFGWIWIAVGLSSGAFIGLFFYDRDWLGGYASWRRRMLRLGHISFIGTGLLNLAYALTLGELTATDSLPLASWMFVLGGITMPLVCFLAAWKDALRRLFVVPVASLIVASVELCVRGLL